MKTNERTEDVLFRKSSLAERLADTLRGMILAGEWERCVPTERVLSIRTGASRPVIRKAMHGLARDGLVRITPGHPTKVVASTRKSAYSRSGKRVVMLTRLSDEGGGDWQTHFMKELRSRLKARGILFEVVADRRLPRMRVSGFLRDLVQQHAADCWILSSVPLAVQVWFQKEGVPAVIDGSSFPQIALPSADFDHCAIGRHAAGTLLGLGHRNIAIFFRSWETAGDRAMEAGFKDAMAGHRDANLMTIFHSDDVGAIRARLKALLARPDRPTAIVVSSPMIFLVIMTALLEWGYKIPDHISLIAQNPDTFMNWLTPTPARYEVSAIKQAHAVCRLVENPSFGRGHVRQIPPFFPGKTLAVPPK